MSEAVVVKDECDSISELFSVDPEQVKEQAKAELAIDSEVKFDDYKWNWIGPPVIHNDICYIIDTLLCVYVCLWLTVLWRNTQLASSTFATLANGKRSRT
jgi:hypothetical protein